MKKFKSFIDRQILKLALKRKPFRGLRRRLIDAGKTRWLDIGSTRFDPGFHCLSLDDPNDLQHSGDAASLYFQCDLLKMTQVEISQLGKWHLVRMQHVLEHFSFEDGLRVIEICAQLLMPGGYLLISVPDLQRHIKGYLSNYRRLGGYKPFAQTRIPHDAPASCVFSVFAHQMGYSPLETHGSQHKWCYDYRGLEYQVVRSGGFRDIRELGLFDPLAEIPFTHNRPAEDVCLIAERVN